MGSNALFWHRYAKTRPTTEPRLSVAASHWQTWELAPERELIHNREWRRQNTAKRAQSRFGLEEDFGDMLWNKNKIWRLVSFFLNVDVSTDLQVIDTSSNCSRTRVEQDVSNIISSNQSRKKGAPYWRKNIEQEGLYATMTMFCFPMMCIINYRTKILHESTRPINFLKP